MNTKYTWAHVAYILILIVGCQSSAENISSGDSITPDANDITITTEQFTLSNMKKGPIELRTFYEKRTANGYAHLPNNQQASIHSLMGGIVSQVYFTEGQWVNKGQILVDVSNPLFIDLQEEYLILKANVQYLKEELERKKNLNKSGLAPQQEVLLAQSNHETNQAKLASTSKKLSLYGIDLTDFTKDKLKSNLSIRTPISGFITDINVYNGQYVIPEHKIMSIANDNNMYIELHVLEKDIQYIKEGQKITVNNPNEPTAEYNGTVKHIIREVNASGLTRILCALRSDTDLVNGMYLTAQIIIGTKNSQCLPIEAIVKSNGETYILVEKISHADSFSFQLRKVNLGIEQDGFVEIMNAQDLQDKNILLKGSYFLYQ